MQEIRFDTRLECTGRWRVGAVEGVGRFTYEPASGMTLDVTASDSELDLQLAESHGPLTITGRTSSPFREDVSFVDCYVTHRESVGDEATAKFLVNRAFFGTSASDHRTLSITNISITMTVLNEWARPGVPFLQVAPHKRVGGTSFTISVAESLRDHEIQTENGLITLRFPVVRTETHTSASFEARAMFDIDLRAGHQLDFILANFVRPLENFISLGTGKINSVRTLVIRGTANSGKRQRHISVLFRPVQSKANRAEWLIWPRGLFSLLDVRDDLAARVTAWLDVYSHYRTVCDQLFYMIYNPQYLESYFLWLIQTFEGYHRRRHDAVQHRLPRAEYRALVALAARAVPEHQRQIIADALQHGNDVSLRQRLQELTSRYGHLIPGVLPEAERQTFARDCSSARNAMAHHLPREQNLDPAALHRYADFILRILIVGLMLDSGFSDAAVHHALQHGASIVPAQRLGA